MLTTIKKTSKHSFYPAKNTTYDHQLMIFLLHQPLYNLEELQKGFLQTHQKILHKIITPDDWKLSIPAHEIFQ